MESHPKTEHNGPKNGGGYWGRRAEAKGVSRKRRRWVWKNDIRQEVRQPEVD